MEILNLETLRISRNMTQETMAEAMGITQGYYGKLERGNIDLKFSHLKPLAEVLKITIHQLVQCLTGIPIGSETRIGFKTILVPDDEEITIKFN